MAKYVIVAVLFWIFNVVPFLIHNFISLSLLDDSRGNRSCFEGGEKSKSFLEIVDAANEETPNSSSSSKGSKGDKRSKHLTMDTKHNSYGSSSEPENSDDVPLVSCLDIQFSHYNIYIYIYARFWDGFGVYIYILQFSKMPFSLTGNYIE